MPVRRIPNDVYILSVRLVKSQNPTISRILYVPTHLDFERFHLVLQAAFGWTNSHLYSFTVSEPKPPGRENDVLCNTKDFLFLHDSVRDWDNDDSKAEVLTRATSRTLASIFANPRFADAKARVVYDYDFADGWGHEITFLGKGDSEAAKRQLGIGVDEYQRTWCVAGEGHPCAENCGGGFGWEQLKMAFGSGWNLDEMEGESPADLRNWYATHCLNGERQILKT